MSEVKDKVITREYVLENDDDGFYAGILEHETHHNHEIIETENGVWRWKKDPALSDIVDKFDFNNLIRLLFSLGLDKNSEVYRRLYRGIGYSLYGYWEIFYWDMNNPDAEAYPVQLPAESPGLFALLDDVMNLGMSVRQHQLQGQEPRSGKEALEEFIRETYE